MRYVNRTETIEWRLKNIRYLLFNLHHYCHHNQIKTLGPLNPGRNWLLWISSKLLLACSACCHHTRTDEAAIVGKIRACQMGWRVWTDQNCKGSIINAFLRSVTKDAYSSCSGEVSLREGFLTLTAAVLLLWGEHPFFCWLIGFFLIQMEMYFPDTLWAALQVQLSSPFHILW